MRFIFIDAENVGIKFMQQFETTLNDRVWVTSKLEAVIELCRQRFYHCDSGYQVGANQADFVLIHYATRVIDKLSLAERKGVVFELVTNDSSLSLAFSTICQYESVSCVITSTIGRTDIVRPELKTTINDNTLEGKILQAASQPISLNEEVQRKLGIAKSDFTRITNQLIRSQLLIRSERNNKKWVRC